MKKIFMLLAIIFVCHTSLQAQPATEKISILQDKVEIMLPKNYAVISDEKTGPRFFQPDMINSPGAGLGFRLETDSIHDNEIPAYTDQVIQQAKAVSKKYKYIDDGIYLQDGKNISYVKFSSKEGGRKMFNFIFFLSVENKPLIFTFTSPFKEKSKWETEIESIANSIKVKS